MKKANPSRGKKYSGGSIILTASGRPELYFVLLQAELRTYQLPAFALVRAPPIVSPSLSVRRQFVLITPQIAPARQRACRSTLSTANLTLPSSQCE